ncbi:WD40-repeat-containing domain protein [Halenospora varia]|nr:WD40-repeat-containing domain protein [Halenospora varia]
MLPNPLTPPHNDSPSTFETYDGATVAMETNAGPISTGIFVTTPVSVGTDFEAQHESLYTDSLPVLHSYTSNDDDQDMSDGGAPLSFAFSNMQQVNAGMNQADIALGIGPEDFTGLLHNAQYSAADDEDIYFNPDSFPSPDGYDQDMPDPIVDFGEADIVHPVMNNANLPTSMSEVSLQLEQLQGQQQHADLEMAPEEHGGIQHLGTPPLPLPCIPPLIETDNGSGSVAQVDYISLAEVSSMNDIPPATAAAGLQANPHIWETDESATISTLDSLVADMNQDAELLEWGDGSDADADELEVPDHRNSTLAEFLSRWARRRDPQESKRFRYPDLSSLHEQGMIEGLEPMRRCDLQGEYCDIQRINWNALGVSRFEAKEVRRQSYVNYANINSNRGGHTRQFGKRLPDSDNYFKFRRMDFDHDVHLTHFQLRNLMGCSSRGHVFYAAGSKINQWNPSTGVGYVCRTKEVLNLTDPSVKSFYAPPDLNHIQITTMDVGHDILVAGGFFGEYALVNLRAHKDTNHTEGQVVEKENSITNHVQVHPSRGSSSPLATFSSNDGGVRILDINTNKFIAEHNYAKTEDDKYAAINCSAISPDNRLRVLVGDCFDVRICRADTGEVLQSLEGHKDYGFACDWADDGWTVATGNQDQLIKIWDARKWTTSSGIASPLKTIASEMAGVRKVKFSPMGSGKRVLVAAEPADFVNVIDAQTFDSKQVLSFFGEIGGLDFTNDGQDLIVANCDPMRGGLIQYERCDLAAESLHDVMEPRKNKFRSARSHSYDWLSDEEDILDHPKSRGTITHRQRKGADLGVSIGHF